MRYVIGLTGNIASGKSTAGACLAAMGAQVIDADQVAHQVMLPGTEAYQMVVAHFGHSILAPDGTINRANLGAIVFTNPRELAILEQFSHPAVTEIIVRQIDSINAGILVIEAIKLLEAHIQRFCEAIWVVSCTRAQQETRLRARNLTNEQIEQRITAQPPLYTKLSSAHVLLDNSTDLAALEGQIRYAWQCIFR